ncbi:MAG: MBL fold metallo-hydrolase [Candidatus Dormibacteraceae bacterium]
MTTSTTTLTFLATGDPTGLKFTVEFGDRRAIFDFGLQHAPGAAPFAQGVVPRPGHELHDLRALGMAPALDGIYERWDRRTAVFITHLHLDHTGLVRFLAPEVPLHYPAEMGPLRDAAVAGGEATWRAPGAERPLRDRERVEWGAITVEPVAVDHDVPGATGYLITTPDLRLAYTGDHRWHGLHPERTRSFAEAASGCEVLIQEAVGLSTLPADPDPTADPDPAPAPLAEADVSAGFERVLRETRGLVVLNAYPMNRERVAGFAAACARAGRKLVLEEGFARTAGLESTGSLAAARLDPARHAVQLSFTELPALLDLDLADAAYVHSDGMPLGWFDPAHPVLLAWVERLGLRYVVLHSSGHTWGRDLPRIASIARPGVVLPVHSRTPERYRAPAGVGTLLPEAGHPYTAGELLQHAGRTSARFSRTEP